MKALVIVTTAALALAVAAQAGTWRVVKSGHVSGQFAVTSISATVSHPQGIEIRLTGAVSSGNAVISCERGFSVSAHSATFSHAGTFRLKINPAHAESCDVTAAVGGSGKVTVSILKYS